MAHFAKIGVNNYVIDITVIADSDCLDDFGNFSETKGVEFCHSITGYPLWVQCSYNTRHGEHLNGGTPLRKNYPGVQWKYDADRDAFIRPKPYASWTLNETTCDWDPPIPRPETATSNGLTWVWSEENQTWEEFGEVQS